MNINSNRFRKKSNEIINEHKFNFVYVKHTMLILKNRNLLLQMVIKKFITKDNDEL